MLEATIGLNEVAAKEAAEAETGAAPGGEGTGFTQNDLHFLRSLRISVEGEEEGAGRTRSRAVFAGEAVGLGR